MTIRSGVHDSDARNEAMKRTWLTLREDTAHYMQWSYLVQLGSTCTPRAGTAL